MRKGLVVLLAAVVVVTFAVPAMADLSASGFVRIKGHMEQNYVNQLPGAATASSHGGFILPAKDPQTASYMEERARIKFDFKGENAGAVAFFEIDFARFGDSAYTVARNQGAGLEGDSINLETKNLYLWFNIPNTSAKVTAGLQNASDSFGGMIFGYADLAGIFVTGKMDPVEYRLGWSKFAQGSTTLNTSVDLYVAEGKFAPTKDAKVGLDIYVLRDASGRTSAGGGTTGTNLATALRLERDYGGPANPTLTYDPSVFYFIGADGSFNAGPAKLSGYAFYNFGTIKKAIQDGVGPADDVDLKAWAIDLRGDVTLGPGKAFLEAAYVSGTSDSDSDVKTPVTASNYALAGSFPLTSMDTQILFPNLDDINASSALAYDVQNKLRGIIAVAAGYTQKFTDSLSGKFGLAYLTDAKNTAGGPVKKHKATEVNANVNYDIVKGMNLGLYGAYAFLSDWEAYSGGVANLAQEADDIYKVYVRMNYAF